MRAFKGKGERAIIPQGVSVWRTLVLVAFGITGAYLLGTVAYSVLDSIYRFLMINIVKSKDPGNYGGNSVLNTIPFAVLGAILGAYVGDRLQGLAENLGSRWDKMYRGDKINVFLGIFAGLFVSVPFVVLFQTLAIESIYKGIATVAVIFGCTSLSIYLLQSIAEWLPWCQQKGNGRRTGIKLLDTNVIIDGRIYDVARSGFLDGDIYVPGFVLDELQYIADSHDGLRRQRGRRGLEVLRHLQADLPLEVRIYDRLAPEAGDGVDARLVRLAKALGADIITNDFNLNRVAALQDIKVLNLNDLSLALRPNVLPQETLELTLIREGNQSGQGIGYLEDGTMVVVENGKPYLGATLEVVVTQVIQTERGKMIFGRIDNPDDLRADPASAAKRPAKRTNGNGHAAQ